MIMIMRDDAEYTEHLVELRRLAMAVEEIMLNERNVEKAHQFALALCVVSLKLAMKLTRRGSLAGRYWDAPAWSWKREEEPGS